MFKNTIMVISAALSFTASSAMSPTFAQATATIQGTVVNAETGEPLPLVNIVIEGTSRGSGADDNGRFSIIDIPPGNYRLIASALGYETVAREVEVAPTETVRVDFRLRESPLELKGVVITGTRTPRFIKDVPVRTEVITKKALELKSAHNVYEALDGTPGIRVEQQCQSCNFSVLRMQGLGADHTQVLLDGQPIYSGLASVYGLQQLSTAEIDRIEVVKGAGSALYGSNAIAGAINIISAIPWRTEGTVGVELGEYGTDKYDLSAATRKDNIGLSLFVQQNCGDAIDVSGDGANRSEVKKRDGVTDRVMSAVTNAGFNLFIDDVIQTDRLSIRGRLLNETRQGGIMFDGTFENPFTEGTERIATDRYSTDVGYLKHFPAGSELNVNFSAVNHKRNATNDTFLGDYASAHNDTLPSVDILRPYIAEENLYVATLNYLHRLGGSHWLLAGLQYTHNELDESGKYVVVDEDDPDYSTPYTSFSEKHADDVGLYVQDEYSATDDLELVAGLRYDHHKSEDSFRGSGSVAPGGVEPVEYDESSLNPRVAVKYSATPALTLRGSVGTGFRVPYGFSEDLHLCSGSPRVWKGSELKPEKSISYSVTADYTVSRLGLSLNLYRTELKDAIAFADAGVEADALGYTYEWVNIDDAYVMGAEIGAQFAIARDLALALNLAFNRGEYNHPREDWIGTLFEEFSRKMSRYPETAGGFKVEYSPHDWSFAFDGDYKGKMFIDYFRDEEEPTKIKETEPHIILNAQVFRLFYNRFKLYMGIHNLTDYIQEERHTDDAAFMYAPVYGRIVYGGMQLTLK